MMTTKEQIIELMRKLPDDATIEDAIYKLYVVSKIERGMEQARNGEGIPHEEVMQRFAKWRG
jgi:predicted transcriptional regulator